jgi:hypothetical protein
MLIGVFFIGLITVAVGMMPVSAGLGQTCRDLDGDGLQASIPLNNSQITVIMQAGQRFSIDAAVFAGNDPGAFIQLSGPGSVDQAPIPGTVSFTAPADGVYPLFITVSFTAQAYTYTLTYSCDEAPAGDDTGPVAGPPCGNLADGRINNDPALDCGAPIAVYLASIDIYGIDPGSGRGILAMSINDAVLEGTPPARNRLLSEGTNITTGQWIRVYWLGATNEVLVVTAYADGKPYIIAWPVDNPAGLYHLAA